MVLLMKSQQGKDFGWTAVTSVACVNSRKMIQPRFRGTEFDVCVVHEDFACHPQSVLSLHVCEALSKQGWAGTAFLEGIKVFKVMAWSAKLYARHKETLACRFKSISLVAWAAAIVQEAVAATAEEEEPGEDKTAAWIAAFLMSACQEFPWDTLAVHLDEGAEFLLQKRQTYENDVPPLGAVIWFDIQKTQSAARTLPDSIKEMQKKCSDFLQQNADMYGYHPHRYWLYFRPRG